MPRFSLWVTTHCASMKALPKRKGNIVSTSAHKGVDLASMKALPKRKGNYGAIPAGKTYSDVPQ